MEIPEKLIEILKKAESVAVLTGAGISAESGIKTFRDPDGLWTKLNPAELASVNGFLANPELVWNWYQERRKIINSVEPNPGHYAIAEMEKFFPDFLCITQNIDRLHHKAGSKFVVELHGNIIDNHCFNCGAPYEDEIDAETDALTECPLCGGMIRPSVVWFGEMLPQDAMSAAENAACNCDVFFSIGTASEVYPAAGLPLIAKNYGAVLVEVNPNPTPHSYIMDYCLHAPSGVALPAIAEKIRE